MTKSNCFLFPGQGSQSIGMCSEILDNKFSELFFKKSRDILDYDIKEIILTDPENLLNQTKFTQPAIFIISTIIDQILKKNNFTPSLVAGHSLGEYSALFSAGVLDFEDALKIIKIRAEEMQSAGKYNPGGMLAILGATKEQINNLCNITEGTLVPANFNSQEQVVLSGDSKSIDNALLKCKEIVIRRAIPLNTSGAFHSPLMEHAKVPLTQIIKSIKFNDAKIPVYQNTYPLPEVRSKKIKNNLIDQLEKPVQWLKIITNIDSLKNISYIEVGPGKVLSKLNNRILNNKNTLTYKELLYTK